MSFKDRVKGWIDNANDSLQERRAYIIRKKKIFKFLSVDDIEKLYKHYISKKMTKYVYERDKKDNLVKKEVELKHWEIKMKVYRKLDLEQIAEIIPSVRKKLEDDENGR